MVPITEDLGALHPQEGIVVGHFKPTEGQKINIIGQLRYGCTKSVEDTDFVPEGDSAHHAVADLITGYGVAESVRDSLTSSTTAKSPAKKPLSTGPGNVASAVACYLAKEGVRIVGIIDREGGMLRPDGMTLEEVKVLFILRRQPAQSCSTYCPSRSSTKKSGTGRRYIYPRRSLQTRDPQNKRDALLAGGIEVIACGRQRAFCR